MKFRVFPIGCGRFLKFLKNFYTCCDIRMIGNPLTLFSHPRRIGSNTKSSWLDKIPHVCMFWLSTWNKDSGSQPGWFLGWLLNGSLLIQNLPQKLSPAAIQLAKWQALAVDPVNRYLQCSTKEVFYIQWLLRSGISLLILKFGMQLVHKIFIFFLWFETIDKEDKSAAGDWRANSNAVFEMQI